MTKKLQKNSKFAKLDTNGDGVVSEEEINKAREILQKAMNKDKDKKQIQAANFFKQNV